MPVLICGIHRLSVQANMNHRRYSIIGSTLEVAINRLQKHSVIQKVTESAV